MTTPEGKVKADIVAYLKTLVPDLWFWCVQDRFTSGIMDIVGCYHGQFIAIEVKRPRGKARRLQRYIMDKAIKAGAEVIVADDVSKVHELIGRLDARRHG